MKLGFWTVAGVFNSVLWPIPGLLCVVNHTVTPNRTFLCHTWVNKYEMHAALCKSCLEVLRARVCFHSGAKKGLDLIFDI